MDPELIPVLEREMEVYAGFLEHTDAQVGRLIDTLEDLEILGDTLVYYIIGDNGASAEGTLQGAFNEMANFNGMGALVHRPDRLGPDRPGHRRPRSSDRSDERLRIAMARQ